MPQEQCKPYREIRLNKGQIARVSPHRFDEINAFNWTAQWSKCTRTYYAYRAGPIIDGKQTTIFMHRQIMGLEYGDPRQVDHVDPNKTLDNTDDNLRLATIADQRHNQRKRKTNTSGFKGVSPDKYPGKWRAAITINGKDKNLGTFATKELAYAAYCSAAKEAFGEFARFE